MSRSIRFLLCALIALLAVPTTAAAAGPPVGFAKPVFVDEALAGGEPLAIADPVHGTIAYTSHEGTTHLYRNGIVTPLDFGANYRNQVNVWTSTNGGATWTRDDLATFQGADPSKSQGFSDPDFTLDEGARIYDTGINLANDSIFSSIDGGKTFDKGTAQCHNGDRPWLAGGRKDEAFMATNTGEDGHAIFRTTDGGNTCEDTGIADEGSLAGGTSYMGAGKIFYDHQLRRLIEPVLFTKGGDLVGIGVGTGKPGDEKLVPIQAAPLPSGMFAHWPSIALDSSDNVYMVWDTNERAPNGQGGCGNLPPPGPASGPAPLPNSIQMAVSKDFGRTWSRPETVARPAGRRVLWPWVVAGTSGKASVVWYETTKLVDPDCQQATVSVREAQIFNATDPAHWRMTTVDPIGRPIHDGSTVCQGGTSCVATGQDRRLGDFFTNAIDVNGCVLIATGDTTKPDPMTGTTRPIALPLFVRQNSGESLTGDDCAKPGSGRYSTNPFALGPGGVTASCRDRTPPRTRFLGAKARKSRTRLHLHGTSSDTGCRNAKAKVRIAGRVSEVKIAIARILGHKRCRFVKANGRLGARRACARHVYHNARGTKRWSYTVARRLPHGHYRVWVRAIDAKRNHEHLRRASHIDFRL
jgi:hypothetical protein